MGENLTDEDPLARLGMSASRVLEGGRCPTFGGLEDGRLE